MTELICPQCGRSITDEFGFCPACGFEYRKRKVSETGSGNVRYDSSVKTGDSDNGTQRVDIVEQYSKYMATFRQQMMHSNRKMSLVMLGIWVAMAFFLGVFPLVVPESMVRQYVNVSGLGSQLMYEGIIFLVSGSLALVSLLLCYKTKYYQVAFYACIASAFSTLGFLALGETICIYLVLCGLLTALRLRNFKGLFKDRTG